MTGLLSSRRRVTSTAAWGRGHVFAIARPALDLLQPFDNAQIAYSTIAERLQSVLVSGAVMCRDGLLDAREFGDDDPFLQAGLVGHGGGAAGQKRPPKAAIASGASLA